MLELLNKDPNHYPVPFSAEAAVLPEGLEVNGRFVIEGVLGAGGQARVYGASDEVTGLQVALKVPVVNSDETLSRVVREAEVTKALSNESDDIVPHVYDGVSHDLARPFLFLATENMPGQSMAHQLEDSAAGNLAVSELVKIVTPAFRGAAHAHKAKLVHRDLKPGNIFIDKDGYGKLGDWGITAVESFEPEILELHSISPEVVEELLTKADWIIGTPKNIPHEEQSPP